MNSAYESLQQQLPVDPKRWLVTGAAGFIGSHLVENLLRLGQEVTSLDNYSTGSKSNLDSAVGSLSDDGKSRLRIVEGDLADPDSCREAVDGADYILHQGGLGSVPRSIDDPELSHRNNVTGTLNLFVAAKDAGMKRVVFASSSSVYGDEPELPKREEKTGHLLSPYAATKAIAEQYADAFSRSYGMEFAGLRYFNVFGPRQDPEGPYAAVIPIWVKTMLSGQSVTINGDGETSRDFTFVDNVVQANLLAATATAPALALADPSRAFNVAFGTRVTLNELFIKLRDALVSQCPGLEIPDPIYQDFRVGDVRHSLADLSRAHDELGYRPTHDLEEGLDLSMKWYAESFD